MKKEKKLDINNKNYFISISIYFSTHFGRAENINLFKYKFIMTYQSKQIRRKKRKTYNIEGHAYELTFSCYHQYNYLNDPQCCTFLMEELSSVREKYQFYIEANPFRADLVENPEDWKWSSARAGRYKEGLVPDDSDMPFLMK